MAKRSIKKHETDFEIPADVQTEAAQAETNPTNVSITESPETDTHKGNPAEDAYEKMMADFETPLEQNETVIITEDKTKRGRKKKIIEDQQILIPGELVVAVVDNIGAGGLSLIDRWVSKNPLPIERLSLTEKQAEKLAPLAEKAIESLQIAKDPLSAFAYTYLAMSISNYVVLKAMQKKETNVKSN